MADNLDNRTLNGKLISGGFDVEESIPNKKLPEYLTKIMMEFAQGKNIQMCELFQVIWPWTILNGN